MRQSRSRLEVTFEHTLGLLWMARTVVISGIGPISCVGTTVDSFWESVLRGESGVEKLTAPWLTSAVKSRVASLVKDFSLATYVGGVDPSVVALISGQSSRTVQLGVAAAMQAVRDADVTFGAADRDRIGVFCGTFGNFDHTTFVVDTMRSGKSPSPASAFLGFPGTMAGIISSILDIRGPADTISGGCPSGMDALGYAKLLIQRGTIDAAIVVGADNEACELTFTGIDASNGLSTEFNDEPKKASRPFDRRRGGNVIGENACALFVESDAHALKRGASKVYASVEGYAKVSVGQRSYSHSKPNLDIDAPSRCFKLTLRDAGWKPGDVSLISANGSASVSYDKLEAWEIWKVFPNTKVHSIKGIIGQSGSGCTLLQIAAACLCLRNKKAYGTLNFEEQDPALPVLNIVKSTHDDPTLDKILCHAIGLGGFHFSGLALRALPSNAKSPSKL
eukprot:TRINITY_DN6261_c0_g1_i1.p1 TRINITY_DN6261_c0_g1~~TRINITY_DN6261_c0_g1_i1.p1  ORF type:complete len:450 (-),score=50.19 TRINITY_DN6261_c0_g1_i1:2-1351(-)